jgi:hypothetical protein
MTQGWENASKAVEGLGIGDWGLVEAGREGAGGERQDTGREAGATSERAD